MLNRSKKELVVSVSGPDSSSAISALLLMAPGTPRPPSTIRPVSSLPSPAMSSASRDIGDQSRLSSPSTRIDGPCHWINRLLSMGINFRIRHLRESVYDWHISSKLAESILKPLSRMLGALRDSKFSHDGLRYCGCHSRKGGRTKIALHRRNWLFEPYWPTSS